MKHLLFILLALCSSNCHKFPESPCDDEDLRHKPDIVRIEPDADFNLVLYLDFGYSEKSNILLERKTKGGFERTNYERRSQTALVDTSFNKELDYNFIYRVSVEKSGCRSDYSNEKSFDYISKMLYAPAELHTTTLELQGIRLEWRDRSGKEDGYKIEKNDGSGWVELVSLPANAQSYFHAISGIPSLPLQLSYRVRVFNSTLASKWAEIATSYSGLGAPSNLRITDTTAWHFTIEWQDNSNIETGYLIERNKNGGPFVEIAQANANGIKYIDKITETGRYSYRVRAKKDNLYSLHSNEVSQSVKSVLPIEGLVAYYPFNGNANDESGNGKNGSVSGATLTKDRFGNMNSAYSFDGIDDYVQSANLLNAPNNFTLSIWFYPFNTHQIDSEGISGGDGISGQFYILGPTHGANWGPSYVGVGISAGTNGISVYEHTANYMPAVLVWQGTVDKWNHVVVVYKNRQPSLYLNGEYLKYGQTGPLNAQPSCEDIGAGMYAYPGLHGFFKGYIDDYRIYSRSLTLEEIQALYHEGGW